MKTQFTITVDAEDLDTLRAFAQKARIPISLLIEPFFQGMATAIRVGGYMKKERMTKVDVLRLISSCKML